MSSAAAGRCDAVAPSGFDERSEMAQQSLRPDHDIVWDPPWTPHMISEAGRQKLGLD